MTAVFWNTDRKKRNNHVKLVMQNILAGQEMLTVTLVIYKDPEHAKNARDATARFLSFARKLMFELCDNNTKLSAHNVDEQLRVNKSYRDIFTAAHKVMPWWEVGSFDKQFQPSGGWGAFETKFNIAPLDAVKTVDLFWSNEFP